MTETAERERRRAGAEQRRRRAVQRLLAAAAVAAACAGGAAGVVGCGGEGGAERAPADPLVVGIAVGAGPAPPAAATGFAAAPDRVVTVAHVLEDGAPVRVVGAPGRGHRGARHARVLRVDRRLDLALLAVPGLGAPRTATRAADGPVRLLLRRGGATRAVAASVRRHVTARLRAATGGPVAVRPAVELDAGVRAGDSGAPVVDGRGRVAAVVFAAARSRPGTAYGVDAPALAAFLRRGVQP